MPAATCPMLAQESSQKRSAWSARSYEGMEHPAKPTAARRSWPRWSSMRSGDARGEAVEANRVLASDDLRKVGRQRVDEFPHAGQPFGPLSEELIAADDEAVGECAQHREPAGPHAALANRLCARESCRVNLDAHVQVPV